MPAGRESSAPKWWIGRRFSYGYPVGHIRVSVKSIPFSQLRPQDEEPKAPHCNDRRWNGELARGDELRPGPRD